MELWVLDMLFYISLATVSIPLFLLLFTFNRQTIEYKWLTAILLLSFGCDTTAEILYRLKLPVNFASSIWATVHPILFCWFFYFSIGWKNLKPAVVVVSVTYFLFALTNLLFIQKFDINSYSNIVGKLIIMIFSIAYYYKLLKEMPTEKIHKVGLFLIISAYFFTTSAMIILFSFVEYLIKIYSDNLIPLWSIHNGINSIGNLVIGWGVWLNIRQMNATRAQPNASSI